MNCEPSACCKPRRFRGFFMFKKLLQLGPLFVVIAALLWSADDLLRRSLYVLPPTTVVFYEHLLGAGVLLFLFPVWIKDLRKMGKKEWIAVVFDTVFAGLLGTIFYTAALGKVNYIPFSVVVLLQQLQPIWAIFAAIILLKEKATKGFLGWAILALISAYFVTFPNLRVNLATGAQTVIGGLLALGAGFMWGSSTAISKVVLNRVSSLTTTALRFYLAPLIALVYLASLNQLKTLGGITPSQWIILLGITFSTGMVALFIYNFGLKKTPARIASLCELVWPISSVVLGFALFHQALTFTQFLGAVGILTAIYFVTKSSKEKIAESPKS